MKKGRFFIIFLVITHLGFFLGSAFWFLSPGDDPQPVTEEVEEEPLLYGIPYQRYEREEMTIRSGQTLSAMIDGFGLSARTLENMVQTSKPLFDTRLFRAGNKYVLFFEADSIAEDSLEMSLRHMVYLRNAVDYVRYDFLPEDSVAVTLDRRPIETVRRRASAAISSSLWNCITANDLPLELTSSMEDVFGWTVDFFGLQKTDSFTVIYDEQYVDSVRIGVGQIWGGYFYHAEKDIYAIPFAQDSVKVTYWDLEGKSLRKQLLKAPLNYTRISSRFTGARLHPVLKTVRAHYGVDYAAPSGTPVVAIADGVVTQKGWTSGGGNTIGLRHANGLSSTYMHLRGYASGLAQGGHVRQGEVIGYVGSTGLSTGPHLDFRLYKNGTPIDPLKAPSDPLEPIDDAHMDQFIRVRDLVLEELRGTLPQDSLPALREDLYPGRIIPDSIR